MVKLIRVVIDGKEFRSVKAVCAYMSVNPALVYYRISKGMSADQAVKHVLAPGKRRVYKYFSKDGLAFSSLKEVANHYQVLEGTLRKYRGSFKYIDDAVECVRIKERKVVYKGVTYRNVKGLADKLDVSPVRLSESLNKGLSVEKAVKRCNRIKNLRDVLPINFTIEGVTYLSVSSFCTSKGLSAGSMRKLLREGFSLEEAYHKVRVLYLPFELAIREIIQCGFGSLLVGQKVDTLQDLCKLAGVTRTKYRGRKNLGWSNVEALELVSRK